jgi:hypothetical protein
MVYVLDRDLHRGRAGADQVPETNEQPEHIEEGEHNGRSSSFCA